MRNSAAATIWLVSIVVGFAVGAWMAMHNGWGSQVVVANIVNESGRTVRAAVIHFGTCGGKGAAVVGELRPGASHQVRYSVCGEGGYTVEATFDDGSVVKGNEGYVEVGYVSTDRISADRVTSTQSTYGGAL
jgi:hypothetical protein